MALDLATRAFLKQLALSGAKPLHESTPEEARAVGRMLRTYAGPGPDMARVEEHRILRPDGAVVVRVLVPQQDAQGIIIYYHGGGWVRGELDDYDSLARKLAERASCAVVLVGYRLAPEHPYPCAVDDSYAALEWAAAHAREIAGRGVPLIAMGDSAGGGLAAVTALRARDRGGPLIALQVLVNPITDSDFGRPSYIDPANQLLLTREGMAWFWDHYLPDTAKRFEPDASPLRADDLTGLPPASILIAEHDVLRDEGEAYARRLVEAGGRVDCRVHTGQMHGFFTLLMLPGGERGLQQVVQAVRACIVRHAERED